MVRAAVVGDAARDADAYFGKAMRAAAKGTRLSRAQALKTYFVFCELRHKTTIYPLTGHVAECPVDEMNWPRGGQGHAALRIPPDAGQVARLFPGDTRSWPRAGS